MHFSEKSAIFKRKGKSKIIKYHTKLLLLFSNNVGWMTNFENTNQLFQSSVKTICCSSEIFLKHESKLKIMKNYTHIYMINNFIKFS